MSHILQFICYYFRYNYTTDIAEIININKMSYLNKTIGFYSRNQSNSLLQGPFTTYLNFGTCGFSGSNQEL